MSYLRYFLLLFVVFANVFAFSQVGTFSKIFTTNSYDEGIAAFRMPNKTYRIIANTGAWGWGSNNIWYIALDTNANFVRHKTIGYGRIDKAHAAAIDSKGNTYIVGSSTSEDGNSYQMLFIALDSSGALITKKFFGGTDWDFGNGIKVINDTTLILVGETYSYAAQQSNAWVMKIKINGDIIWSKSFGGNRKEAFYAVDQAKNGDLYCVGNSQSYGNGSFDPYMIRCSTLGDSLGFVLVKDTADGKFLDIKIAADSSYYLSGYQWDTSNTYHDLLIRYFSKDNQMLWNEDYILQEKNASFNALAFHDNNVLGFGKTTLYGSGGDNMYGAKLNKDNGTWMSGLVAGEMGDESAYSVTTDTSNNQTHYLIIGTSTSYNMQHSGVYFLRVNYDLELDRTMVVDIPTSIGKAPKNGLNMKVIYDANQQRIMLYGEPMADSKTMIKVYDVVGRCVYSEQWITDEQFVISTHNWAKGAYSVEVTSGLQHFLKMIVR